MKYSEFHQKVKRMIMSALKASDYAPGRATITPVRGGWFSNPTEDRQMFDRAKMVLESLRRKYEQKPMSRDEIDRFVDGEIAYSHYMIAQGLMHINPGRYIAEAREAIAIMKQVGHSEAGFLERMFEQKLGRK